MLQAIKDLSVDGVVPSYGHLANLGLRSKGRYLLDRFKAHGRITWDPR